MKKLIKLFSLLLFAVAFAGCGSDNDPFADGNHRLDLVKGPKVYKYKLSFGGDFVDQSEEPLSRDQDANTYVGINVTCRDKNNPAAESQNYAYGVFDRKEGISINLISGYTYDFEATILRDGTDKFYVNNRRYGLPFVLTQGSSGATANFEGSDLNKFIYDNDPQRFPSGSVNMRLCALSYGSSYIDIKDNKKVASPANYAYPRVDRYYGELDGVDPVAMATAQTNSIDINLTYKCFGLTIDATDIPDGTSLSFADTSDRKDENNLNNHLIFPQDLKLTPGSAGSAVYKNIYSLNDLKSNQPVTFRLTFTWHRGMGETKTFSCDVDVIAGVNKILKINIDGAPNTQYVGNINLIEGSSDLSDEEKDINATF